MVSYAFDLAPRCGAKTRAGTPCKSPAVRLNRRCRMHGGARGSGAPKGNSNAITHGFTTAYSKLERRLIKQLLQESRLLISENF